MSRIGKKQVSIPDGVKVELAGGNLKVASSSATLTLSVNPVVDVAYDSAAGHISVTRKGDDRFSRAMHGTTRALIANMVHGVTKGFEKRLHVFGTGYGVKIEGKQLLVTVGYAKPASVTIPDGVTVDVETPNARGNDVPAAFAVRGADKCTVGQFAAAVRKTRVAEPYKGKGVRYVDEVIKRKLGKAFGSGGA